MLRPYADSMTKLSLRQRRLRSVWDNRVDQWAETVEDETLRSKVLIAFAFLALAFQYPDRPLHRIARDSLASAGNIAVGWRMRAHMFRAMHYFLFDLGRAEAHCDTETRGAQEILLEGAQPAVTGIELDFATRLEPREFGPREVGGKPNGAHEDGDVRSAVLRGQGRLGPEHEVTNLRTATQTTARREPQPEDQGEPKGQARESRGFGDRCGRKC